MTFALVLYVLLAYLNLKFHFANVLIIAHWQTDRQISPDYLLRYHRISSLKSFIKIGTAETIVFIIKYFLIYLT